MEEFRNIEEEIIYNKLMVNRLPRHNSFDDQNNAVALIGSEEIMDVEKVSRCISELGELINTLKETSENYAFRPLFSDVKVIGKGIIFAKRVIRKLLKWYIEPICFQQTTFNTAVTRSVEQIAKLQTELAVSVAELARRSSQSTAKEDDREDAARKPTSIEKP